MPAKILLFAENIDAAKAEVERAGGRVVHEFSPAAFVAELPMASTAATLTESRREPASPLDEGTELAVKAWRARLEAQASLGTEGAASATEGLRWDTPGYEPPKHPTSGAEDAPGAAALDVEESTGTPTSHVLLGSVAVGIVMVSRDSGAEQFSDAERQKIIQEVQEGLDFLATVEPKAKVSFAYDIRQITVSTPPGPYSGAPDAYERMEKGWRDAALAIMGYAAGRPGYQQYANDLRASRKTDWSYVALFTKYALNHFAYAIDEKVVMNYFNDGWGPDNINRVFAHESCHIFGAADEYGSCSCSGRSGFLSVLNSNCVNCFPPGGQTDCLMNQNTLLLCNASRGQIGWDARIFPRAAGLVVRRGNRLLVDADFNGIENAARSISYGNGNSEHQYLIGNFGANGRAGVAVRRDNVLHIDANFDGITDKTVAFGNGNAEDGYFAGDFAGANRGGIAVRRGNVLHIDSDLDGVEDMTIAFGNGNAEDQYLIGNFGGNGRAGIAVRRGNVLHIDTNLDGVEDKTISYGNGASEDEYLVVHFAGNQKAGIAVRRDNVLLVDSDLDGVEDFKISYGNGNSDQYLTGTF